MTCGEFRVKGRRRSVQVLRPATATLAIACPLKAFAGAFLQPADQGVVIVGSPFSNAVRAHDAYGRLAPVAAWREFELDAYAEYGVTDWLTVIAKPQPLPFSSKPAGAKLLGDGHHQGRRACEGL